MGGVLFSETDTMGRINLWRYWRRRMCSIALEYFYVLLLANFGSKSEKYIPAD